MREEDKLDCLLAQEAGELPPPPEVEREITPWRRAMHRIVWGIGLTTCTLNVWNLDTAMLMVGTVMLWLGFRALRRENRWFTACWGISLIEVVFRLAVFILNATTTWGAEYSHGWLTYFALLLPLVQYVCLWQAIKEVRRRAGQPVEARAAGALIWFYLVLTALALLNVQGLIFVVAILVIYILILRSLSKFSNLLDEAGYQVQPALVRISDRSIWILWCVALLVCISTAPILFGRYPMDWSPRPEGEQAGLEDVRDHLAELGYPEDALADLSADDLAACDGALSVTADVWSTSVRDHQISASNLYLTSVAVELPEQQWRFFHHFFWSEGPELRTTECIWLWPVYLKEDDWQPWGELSGRLLYDLDGVTYTGKYYRLEDASCSYDTLFSGTVSASGPVAVFSPPVRGERCRGYVAYGALGPEAEERIMTTLINYTHQADYLNYPFRTALESELGGYWSDNLYHTAQDKLLFTPDP